MRILSRWFSKLNTVKLEFHGLVKFGTKLPLISIPEVLKGIKKLHIFKIIFR